MYQLFFDSPNLLHFRRISINYETSSIGNKRNINPEFVLIRQICVDCESIEFKSKLFVDFVIKTHFFKKKSNHMSDLFLLQKKLFVVGYLYKKQNVDNFQYSTNSNV